MAKLLDDLTPPWRRGGFKVWFLRPADVWFFNSAGLASGWAKTISYNIHQKTSAIELWAYYGMVYVFFFSLRTGSNNQLEHVHVTPNTHLSPSTYR